MNWAKTAARMLEAEPPMVQEAVLDRLNPTTREAILAESDSLKYDTVVGLIERLIKSARLGAGL